METEDNRLRAAARIAAAVATATDSLLPLDILVWEPGQLEASFARKGNFATEVVTKGIVLYEAGNRGVD